MAKYEYECPEHGVFEVERSIFDKTPDTADCPVDVPDWEIENAVLRCGAKSPRVFSPPGIIFRWHH